MTLSVFNAVPDVIAAHARHRPSQEALVQGETVWTWKAFASRVDAVAARLRKLGVRRGHRVALLSTNRIEAYAAAFGILRAGAVATPLSPLLTSSQLAALIADSGAKLLFLDPVLAPLAQGLTRDGKGGPRVLALDEVADEPERSTWQAPALAPGDLATLIYSSGTTGQPKGIPHDHLARLVTAAGLAVEFAIRDNSRTLLITPLHTNGTWMMALPTLVSGGTIILASQFDPSGIFALIEQEHATHMFAVPTMLRAMLAARSANGHDLSSMVMCVSAGSALPAEVKRAAHDMLGGRLGELYGLTEGVATILKPDELLEHIETVGRPGGGVEIVILDDEGRELPPGVDGEIAGRSGGLMQGYFGSRSAMRGLIWKDRRGRKFFRTGDMGRMGPDGYLTITDRKKDMIVSGGLNVFATDIEVVLATHPDVADVAVIATPDAKWGETPVAIVIPRSDKASPDAIISFANERLGKHQRVSKVILRETDFPRNALGKVLKRELREQYRG